MSLLESKWQKKTLSPSWIPVAVAEAAAVIVDVHRLLQHPSLSVKYSDSYDSCVHGRSSVSPEEVVLIFCLVHWSSAEVVLQSATEEVTEVISVRILCVKLKRWFFEVQRLLLTFIFLSESKGSFRKNLCIQNPLSTTDQLLLQKLLLEKSCRCRKIISISVSILHLWNRSLLPKSSGCCRLIDIVKVQLRRQKVA